MANKNLNLKKCILIHDIAGYGKCSLTEICPVMSAMNVQTVLLPTAVFSNHTAFSQHEMIDLTEKMLPFAKTWKNLGLKADSIFAGFLGSVEQINIVSEIIDMFTDEDRENKLIMIDPVMGDNGKLYRTITDELADGMISLCKKADIITPNITEAARLTGMEYKEAPYTEDYIENMLHELLKLGVKYAVLTGVGFDSSHTGAAIMGTDGIMHCSFSEIYEGKYHGTGDIFAAVLLSKLLNGEDAVSALNTAVKFTSKCILNTIEAGQDPIEGVIFEPELSANY